MNNSQSNSTAKNRPWSYLNNTNNKDKRSRKYIQVAGIFQILSVPCLTTQVYTFKSWWILSWRSTFKFLAVHLYLEIKIKWLPNNLLNLKRPFHCRHKTLVTCVFFIFLVDRALAWTIAYAAVSMATGPTSAIFSPLAWVTGFCQPTHKNTVNWILPQAII